jgi:hypothetical protein
MDGGVDGGERGDMRPMTVALGSFKGVEDIRHVRSP